jgi:hypothetical protein
MGAKVFCERFGKVRIDGITDAPILWRFTKRSGGRASLILFAGVLEALRWESNIAMCDLGASPHK